jgi:hypothetical protein
VERLTDLVDRLTVPDPLREKDDLRLRTGVVTGFDVTEGTVIVELTGSEPDVGAEFADISGGQVGIGDNVWILMIEGGGIILGTPQPPVTRTARVRVVGGGGTFTPNTYAPFPASVEIANFVKKRDDTKLLCFLKPGIHMSSGTTAEWAVGIRVTNQDDATVTSLTTSLAANNLATASPLAGNALFSVLAGTYTIEAVARRLNATGTMHQHTSFDTILSVSEVF